jgi:hypothetical protein
MKKSKSDLINSKYYLTFEQKNSSRKILQIRLSLIERIRSIWKITTKRTPIIFRKVYPPSVRHKIPITTKTSFGFTTNDHKESINIIETMLTKQISISSFHTARESNSSLSFDDTESIRMLE